MADLTPRPTASAASRGRLGAILIAVALLLAGLAVGVRQPAAAGPQNSGEVRILGSAPATYDPAAQSDILSASVSAQLFENLTTFDPELVLRPALARTWDVADGGRRIVFHLRPGLEFSDGSPLTGADVVRSWLRLVNPARPSPLASLMSDVVGADDYRSGRSRDPATVGIGADGLDVTVRLVSPASDFPAIASAGPFAIVPPGIEGGASLDPGGFIGSGAYVLAAVARSEITLRANSHYWAGPAPIGTVHLLTDIGGRSPVSAFEDGDLDYTQIGWFDASWIRFDPGLGPELRSIPSLSVEYLGFDTSRSPFADVRVRQAFGAAVDWRRIVSLANPGDETPATSLVPPGVPGRGSGDYLPSFDLARARDLLGQAGFAGGKGFPGVTFVTGGTAYGAAIRAALQDALGVTIGYETMEADAFFDRLSTDSPAIWTLGWVADYPGPNDFLGVLLRSRSTNNPGRWSNGEFDQAIADAGAATDAAAIQAAFGRAQEVVRRDVPVVPLASGDTWALARNGLLGGRQNGLGILRFAGLAWSGS